VDFGTKNNLRLHYNTVINNKNSFPDWYWNLSPPDKKSFLESHVRAVVGRYEDQFYLYKLVNEPVRDDEENFLGTDEGRVELIAQIFKWAKEESPNSLMMINDFGNFYKEDVRQRYIALVNKVKKAGGPIDVVGLQGHIWTFELPPDEDAKKALDEINDETELPIYITEFSLSFDNSIYGGLKIDPNVPFVTRKGIKYSNWFDYQGFAYRYFFNLCKKTGYVGGFTFWGFCDEKVAWERPGIGLFDEAFKPKPAFKVLEGVLKQKDSA